jgi:hypothetical protein
MGVILALVLMQADAAKYDDPDKEIQWARTFEEAYEEARVRNVPIVLYLTSKP